jgi:hypothetical protein
MAERSWLAVVEGGACAECGLDSSAVAVDALAAAHRSTAAGWAALLRTADPERLRAHPAPEVWSPLEYGCHVRDVLTNFDGRIQRGLVEDHPTWGWWDHDAAVLEQRYNEQDPATVADELLARAEGLATTLDGIAGPQWERTGERRDGEVFTLATKARFALHESVHHRHDAEAAGR